MQQQHAYCACQQHSIFRSCRLFNSHVWLYNVQEDGDEQQVQTETTKRRKDANSQVAS